LWNNDDKDDNKDDDDDDDDNRHRDVVELVPSSEANREAISRYLIANN
jgi:hypothetical protein